MSAEWRAFRLSDGFTWFNPVPSGRLEMDKWAELLIQACAQIDLVPDQSHAYAVTSKMA